MIQKAITGQAAPADAVAEARRGLRLPTAVRRQQDARWRRLSRRRITAAGDCSMKIASVRALPLVAPLDIESQRTALGGRSQAALVLVEVTTDDGVVGYGEALARYSLRSYVSIIEDLLAPIVVGQNPFEVERLWQRMVRVITGKAGGMLLEAIAAVDIALWDIMGKAAGSRSIILLGSMGRDRIEAYASSISWASDEVAAAQTRQAVAQGFRMIKVKVGPPVERAHCARTARPRDRRQLTSSFRPTAIAPSISMTPCAWRADLPTSTTTGSRNRSSSRTSTAITGCARKFRSASPQARASTHATAAAISLPAARSE